MFLDHWIDLVLVILVSFALVRGFIRGFFREIFGLVGLILAVMAAFYWYQGVAEHLASAYPLLEWQAQILAFTLIAVAVGLLATFVTHVWVRVIRLTPFAVFDRVAGAAFSATKVLLISMLVLSVIWSLGIPNVNLLLQESHVTQQLLLLRPLVYRYGEELWPETWEQPSWLFPGPGTPLDHTTGPAL